MVAGSSALILTMSGVSQAEVSGQITNRNSAKCLEIENSSRSNGARAQQWSCAGDGNRWYRRYITPGAFQLVNVNSGKCLEIADSRKDNGAPAQQWDCVSGAYTQQWYVSAGNSVFFNKNSGKALEIDGSSYSNGARAQQWEHTGAHGQYWVSW